MGSDATPAGNVARFEAVESPELARRTSKRARPTGTLNGRLECALRGLGREQCSRFVSGCGKLSKDL